MFFGDYLTAVQDAEWAVQEFLRQPRSSEVRSDGASARHHEPWPRRLALVVKRVRLGDDVAQYWEERSRVYTGRDDQHDSLLTPFRHGDRSRAAWTVALGAFMEDRCIDPAPGLLIFTARSSPTSTTRRMLPARWCCGPCPVVRVPVEINGGQGAFLIYFDDHDSHDRDPPAVLRRPASKGSVLG